MASLKNIVQILEEVICMYRVIKKDGLNLTVNGASKYARQLVAVFQVLCSLYGLTCVGYAQNPLEFVSRSPLIHAKNQSLTPDDGRKDRPKHIECYSNKTNLRQ